jgi:hypothetical protein
MNTIYYKMNSLYAFPWPSTIPPVRTQPNKPQPKKNPKPPKNPPAPKQPVPVPVYSPRKPSSPWDQ